MRISSGSLPSGQAARGMTGGAIFVGAVYFLAQGFMFLETGSRIYLASTTVAWVLTLGAYKKSFVCIGLMLLLHVLNLLGLLVLAGVPSAYKLAGLPVALYFGYLLYRGAQGAMACHERNGIGLAAAEELPGEEASKRLTFHAALVGMAVFLINGILFLNAGSVGHLTVSALALLLTVGAYKKSRVCIGTMLAILVFGLPVALAATEVHPRLKFAGLFLALYLAYALERGLQGALGWQRLSASDSKSDCVSPNENPTATMPVAQSPGTATPVEPLKEESARVETERDLPPESANKDSQQANANELIASTPNRTQGRWTLCCLSLFLAAAGIAYFTALKLRSLDSRASGIEKSPLNANESSVVIPSVANLSTPPTSVAIPLTPAQLTAPVELKAWQQATQLNTAVALQAFVNAYPNSSRLQEARAAIEELSMLTIEGNIVGSGLARVIGFGMFTIEPSAPNGEWTWNINQSLSRMKPVSEEMKRKAAEDPLTSYAIETMDLYVETSATNYHLSVTDATRWQLPSGTNTQKFPLNTSAIYRIRGKVSAIPANELERDHKALVKTPPVFVPLLRLEATEISVK